MPPKRKAPAAPDIGETRRSTRLSSSRKKSKYFHESDESADELSEEEPVITKPKAKAKAKKRPDSRRKPAKKSRKLELDDKGQEENGEAVDEAPDNEDEEDSDAPPKTTFIPIKLRDEGSVAYADDRLHENTMLFLADLKKNNRRSWLKDPFNDMEFRRAEKDFKSYVVTLRDKLMQIDPTIADLPLKDVIFRIYRDSRFTKDPTPYKPHFSAAFGRTGRKGPYAVYYVHVEPGGNSFVAGGLHKPPSSSIAAIREDIDISSRPWRQVVNNTEFKTVFLTNDMHPRVEKTEEGAMDRFYMENFEGALVYRPKGYRLKHPDIDLLRLRTYTVRKSIPDSVLTDANGQDRIAYLCGILEPFITLLNGIVRP